MKVKLKGEKMTKCKDCKYSKKQTKTEDIYSNNLVCVYHEKTKTIPDFFLDVFILKNGKKVIGELIINKNDSCKRGAK